MLKLKSNIKERWNGLKEKPFWRVVLNKYFIITFLFLVYVLFIDKNNLIRWGRKYFDVVKQEQVMNQYQKDIKEVDDKLKELTSNRDSLEKFAREQYYFQNSDEEVFILDSKK